VPCCVVPCNEAPSHAVLLRPATSCKCPSPQVQYSLLYRKPEENGVLEACREAGVTLVAYSPLCQVGSLGQHLEFSTRNALRWVARESCPLPVRSPFNPACAC
jgi:aryl-alcohol dehydrogenase-like predicted oxidoreductase